MREALLKIRREVEAAMTYTDEWVAKTLASIRDSCVAALTAPPEPHGADTDALEADLLLLDRVADNEEAILNHKRAAAFRRLAARLRSPEAGALRQAFALNDELTHEANLLRQRIVLLEKALRPFVRAINRIRIPALVYHLPMAFEDVQRATRTLRPAPTQREEAMEDADDRCRCGHSRDCHEDGCCCAVRYTNSGSRVCCSCEGFDVPAPEAEPVAPPDSPPPPKPWFA